MGSVIAPHCRFLQLLVVLLFCDGLTAFRDGDGRYILAFLLRRFHIHFVLSAFAHTDVDGSRICGWVSAQCPPAKAEEVEKTNAAVMSRDDLFIVDPYELVECVIWELNVRWCRQRCQRWR